MLYSCSYPTVIHILRFIILKNYRDCNILNNIFKIHALGNIRIYLWKYWEGIKNTGIIWICRDDNPPVICHLWTAKSLKKENKWFLVYLGTILSQRNLLNYTFSLFCGICSSIKFELPKNHQSILIFDCQTRIFKVVILAIKLNTINSKIATL